MADEIAERRPDDTTVSKELDKEWEDLGGIAPRPNLWRPSWIRKDIRVGPAFMLSRSSCRADSKDPRGTLHQKDIPNANGMSIWVPKWKITTGKFDKGGPFGSASSFLFL